MSNNPMPKTKVKLLEGYEKELVKAGTKKEGPIITVSGLSGSGKSSVVRLLMNEFPGLKLVYAGGIFRENAKRLGMGIEEYCAKRGPEDDIETDKEELRRSIGGNAIVDSRLAAWVLGDWADCKIFVYCPLGARIGRVAKREGITVAQARNRLESRDSSDNRKFLELYGIDATDLSLYDFIIDNSGSLAELESGIRKAAKRIREPC